MNSCLRCKVLPLLRAATSGPSVSQVRWKRREPLRKPKWMARAPSKLFLTFDRPAITKDEEEQVHHMYKIYQTKTRSIQRYFREMFYVPSLTAGGKSLEQVSEESDEHARLVAENEEENARIAQLRDERLRHERNLFELEILAREDAKNEELEQIVAEAKAVVDQELKRFPTYITNETLQQAIEEAIANPVNYEFAIDKNGKVYHEAELHPYAAKPNAVPETSSHRDEVALVGQQELKFEEKKLY